MAKERVYLSHISFTLALEEMLSGPFTTKALAERTGMGHRYVNRWVKVMHGKKVVHIAGWEKDVLGRQSQVRVYELGAGKDKPRPTKPRSEVNRDYRAKQARRVLTGTPFAGLGA